MKRMLTAALAGVLALGFATTAMAQDDAAYQKKLEDKLAESWFTDNGFTSDYDKAREMAKSAGKPIFAYFTRSYAP